LIKQALAIAYKDFQIESGKKTLFKSLVFLSVILIFLSSFVVRQNPKIKPEIGSLVIWLILVYILFQTLNRSLAAEDESGCWDALRLCPISSRVVFLGKFIYNSILVIAVQIMTFPFYILFFNMRKSAFVMLVPILLASFGFIASGLLISLMSLKNQGRELLSNVMSLPIFLPALFLGLRSTLDLSRGASFYDIWYLLAYLAVFDLLTFIIAFIAFDTGIAE